MQEQRWTRRFPELGRHQPVITDGWAIEWPLDGGTLASPAEAEAAIVEKRRPLVVRALQSVGRAILSICLSRAPANCRRCNAPIDGYADVWSDGNPFAPMLHYSCRCCGHSWEQYLCSEPW